MTARPRFPCGCPRSIDNTQFLPNRERACRKCRTAAGNRQRQAALYARNKADPVGSAGVTRPRGGPQPAEPPETYVSKAPRRFSWQESVS